IFSTAWCKAIMWMHMSLSCFYAPALTWSLRSAFCRRNRLILSILIGICSLNAVDNVVSNILYPFALHGSVPFFFSALGLQKRSCIPGCATGGFLCRFVQGILAKIMSTQAIAWVDTQTGSREEIMPARVKRCRGILSGQSAWQPDASRLACGHRAQPGAVKHSHHQQMESCQSAKQPACFCASQQRLNL